MLLVNIVLLVGLALVGWRTRAETSTRIFAVLQAVSAVWAALTLVGLQLPAGDLRVRFWGVATGLSLVVAVLWLAFILSYTGRDDLLRSRWFIAASTPLFVGSGLYVAVPSWRPFVGQLDQTTIPAGTVVQSSIGPISGLIGLWVYLVFVVGLLVVVATIVGGNELIVGQSVALLLGSLVTIVASVAAVIGVPVRGYPVTEVALGGQSMLWGYATFRQEFLRAVPAVGRTGEHAVFDELDDGVMVVDDDGTVMRANPEAVRYFDEDGLVGRTISEVVDRPEVSAPSDFRGRFQDRRRTYQVSVSDVTNWRTTSIGKAFVIRDVTELVRRQQRLQVLNRILRHNVRNEMNIVSGIGTQLREDGDGEVAELGAIISEQAERLTTVSEKALEIETVLERPTVPTPVDLERFVETVVEPLVDANSMADVTVEVDPVDVRIDSNLLALVLEEVVENALIHAGDAPTVSVSGTRSGGGLDVTVRDDGPGIPEQELEPIRSGEETDLQHASSLGLWLVFWGTQSLGGDVDVTSDGGGSTVTLSFPDVDEFGTESASAAPS